MAILESEALLREKIQWQNATSTTWYFDLDDLRGINRAWLYMEPKVSVLQANVKLV